MQDGGHQHPRDGLVEDGVANAHDVDHGGGAEDGQHVGRHALPEVQQEALDLERRNTTFSRSFTRRPSNGFIGGSV